MALRKRQVSAETPVSELPAEAKAVDFTKLSCELVSDDASARRQAARALAAMPEATALLCARLEVEPSASVRSIIFTGLIAHPSPAAVEGLTPFLRCEDVGLRNAAIDALQKMPHEVIPCMDLLLADPDSDVRIMAVNILGLLQHPAAPARLLLVAIDDPHVNVCAAALDALAEVGEPEAIPMLELVAHRFPDVPFIKYAVATAVRRIRGGAENA
jgi:HEAT repeat protein